MSAKYGNGLSQKFPKKCRVPTSVVDPDSLNPDPEQAFQVNPDPGF
jgi:hypothetical protein